jgi:alpha-glucuronidase
LTKKTTLELSITANHTFKIIVFHHIYNQPLFSEVIASEKVATGDGANNSIKRRGRPPGKKSINCKFFEAILEQCRNFSGEFLEQRRNFLEQIQNF